MSNVPLGIGVIGAGGIARRRTIPGIQQAGNCRVVAVMDVAGAQDVAKEFDIPVAYTTEAELLADPGVDAVYVATPAYLHRQQVVACAAARKPVLCEKPLALTTADAEVMLAECRGAGVHLQEGYMMPFHGAHRAMQHLIAAGRIGTVVSVRAQLSCWYPPIAGAWRQRHDLGGGGALIDMASHLYHLIEFLVAPIAGLTALTGNLVHDYETEDASTTLLRLTNGAHATVDCFFCIPDAASLNRLEIYGSRGALISEGTIGQDGHGTLRGCFEGGDTGYDASQQARENGYCEIPYEHLNPYTAEFEAFAKTITDGQAETGRDASDDMRLMKMIEQAYAAAASGGLYAVE